MVSLTLLPKTLLLVLIITFSVTLTENLQLADGLSAYSIQLTYEMDVGETQMLTWGIINVNDDPINIEFYATGEGSEFLVFEEFDVIGANSVKELEIFVSIPKDHPNNIEYRPTVFALQRGMAQGESSGAGMIVNVQMENTPHIKIGDNPIYTPPVVIEKKELPTVNPKSLVPPVVEEVVPEETLEEKMKKIQEGNTAPAEVQVDDTWEEEAVPELQVDDNYLEEPIADPEPIVYDKDNLPDSPGMCGVWEWLLSLFGMGKC